MSIEQKEPRVQTQTSATQRRYRTLAVVRQEAITRIEKPLEDSVFVWPHLMVREFFAATIVTVMVTVLSFYIDVLPWIARVVALLPAHDCWCAGSRFSSRCACRFALC